MPESKPSPDFVSLEERAILLRRSALQTRLRLAEQRAALDKITASLVRARENVSTPAPVPAPRPAAKPEPVVTVGPLFPRSSASVPKVAAADSAPVAATLRTEAVRHTPALLRALLPFAAIGAAAMVAHAKMAPRLAVVPPSASLSAPDFTAARDGLRRAEPPVPAEDDGSAEALLLVHEWMPEGGDRSLLDLLGGVVDRPGLPPAWTVERIGPRGFLVRFREGAVDHAFEADLEARSVRPAGESSGLFAGR